MEHLQVYKFGGASVKDAAAILNLCRIVRDFGPQGPLVIVVSAMGKTTNALEEIYDLAYRGEDWNQQAARLAAYHENACEELAALIPSLNLPQLLKQLQHLVADLTEGLKFMHLVHLPESYDSGYDQVVSYGERFSTLLVSTALAQFLPDAAAQHVPAQLIVNTDETWREGKIEWAATEAHTKQFVTKALADGARILVTEGFIGGTADGRTTTLGREGSDYTAAILAYCLRAKSVTIWKDVAGLLNADPKIFPDTVRYPEISYRETIEMAYYGASVIHPKTLKPLADRGIPLYVKSFLDPAAEGTVIHDCQHPALAPAFIRKTDQCLLSFESKDFSFISEENLAVIFAALAQAKLKINVMQNSAISFSVCTDFSERRVHLLLDLLREQFKLHYNTGLTLFTIKNYDAASIQQLTAGRALLLEQRTRSTFQFVCK
ncbi:aspartate kinase [Hymenobacter armeniacus]|uniref:Aspartokinase n=1 Tax=Hymenobacter armeniacus TaxID=2771358 RepID=A0ABR8JNN0_9BACT|nr:aspartate kinase [Hymenobacter armeniacus]MBD2720882.1 aspartate kinase [Hymenobacter armeniacus]